MVELLLTEKSNLLKNYVENMILFLTVLGSEPVNYVMM